MRASARIIHQLFHFPHRFAKAHENSLANEVMTDIQFNDLFDGSDRLNIVECQPMAGMNFKPERMGVFRHVFNFVELSLDPLGLSGHHRFVVCAGVNFDYWRAGDMRGLDLVFLRINKKRYANAGIF